MTMVKSPQSAAWPAAVQAAAMTVEATMGEMECTMGRLAGVYKRNQRTAQSKESDQEIVGKSERKCIAV
jgi:hypothetical protein